MVTETGSIKYQIVSPSEKFMFAVQDALPAEPGIEFRGFDQDPHQALKKIAVINPNVVIVDAALAGDICSLASRVRETSSARVVVAAKKARRGSVRYFLQSGATSFLTKPEIPAKLERAIEVAARQKIFFSQEVARVLPTGDYRQIYLKERIPRKLNIEKETEDSVLKYLREMSELDGVFAPFCFAIQTGLLAPVDNPELIKKATCLPEDNKEALRQYLLHTTSSYGYRETEMNYTTFLRKVKKARDTLGGPDVVTLICTAAKAGILPLDEIGTKS